MLADWGGKVRSCCGNGSILYLSSMKEYAWLSERVGELEGGRLKKGGCVW
jgi:hypothetical protein